MNNEQRYQYFESGKLQRATEIELLDWAGYWSQPGVIDAEISDPLQKAQTKSAVNLILTDLSMMIRKVSRLAISDDLFKTAVPEGITEADIKTVITAIMATKLSWLTGIEEIPEE